MEHVKEYHPLGNKTLLMILLKRSIAIVILLAVLVGGVFVLPYVPSNYIDLVRGVALLYAIFFLLVSVLVIFLGWLEYARYWIFIDEKSFKIRRGLFTTEEIGIPYKHVRDVRTVRTILDQLLGMSDVTIMLSEFDDNDPTTQESIIRLPSLEKHIAHEIKEHIIRRSQIEQVSMTSSNPPSA